MICMLPYSVCMARCAAAVQVANVLAMTTLVQTFPSGIRGHGAP